MMVKILGLGSIIETNWINSTLTLRWTQPSFEQSPCDIEKESSLWLRLCDILSIHASRTPCDSVPKVLEI